MRLGHVLPVLAAAFVTVPAAAGAQEGSESGWTLAPSFQLFDLGNANGWGRGPLLVVQRTLGRTVRLEMAPGGILTSEPGYNFSGITLDLGLGVALTHGNTAITVGAGGSGIVGSDSDGTGGGWGGGYGSLLVNQWFGARVGLAARGVLRSLNPERGLNPSFSLGLLFKP